MSGAGWRALGGEPWGYTPVFVEVTNTLEVPYVTGLQRLTREVVRRLPAATDATSATRVVPLVWSNQLRDYRRLTAAEHARLTGPLAAPAPPRATAAAERLLPAPLVDTLRSLSRSRPVQRARRRWRATRAGSAGSAGASRTELEALRLDLWPRGSVFVDLEAAWHDPLPRAELLPELAAAGVRSMAVVADVMPELFPEWFDPGARAKFEAWLDAHLSHSEHFLCISASTESDLLAHAARAGQAASIEGRTSLLQLGADFAPTDRADADADAENETDADADADAGWRDLLVVSTIEPRKHQDLALDVYDRLRETHPDLRLRLVGKEGWLVDDLVERITGHPDAGTRVLWEHDLDDAALSARYDAAFLSLVPSRYEGYGAPVVEALARGLPAVVSTGGALPEAASGVAELVGPDDVEGWVAAVARHLDDDDHHAAARERVAAWTPPSWDTTAAQLLTAVTQPNPNPQPHPNPQISAQVRD